MEKRFNNRRPLLAQLSNCGLEFDQKLMRALEVSASKPNLGPEDRGFPDSYLTLALYRLNSVLTSLVDLDETRYNLFHEYKLAPRCDVNEVIPGDRLCDVLNKAVETNASGKTLGAGHFLKAIVSLTLDQEAYEAPGFVNQVIHNTFSAETLLWGLGHDAWTPVEKVPELRQILGSLDGRNAVDDVQYMMTYQKGQMVIRPTSELGSFAMAAGNGGIAHRKGILTHFKDQFAPVTPDEILELEDLINNQRVKEAELQRFFEQHPQFLRMWDYREVFPHVYLTREDEGPLIPDFVLLDRDLQKAMIVDLKLPNAKTVVAKKNRDRFSSLILDARSQLLEYKDWFEDSTNREKLKTQFGMEVFRPSLGVVVGSSREFASDYQKQKLRAQYADVEVVTYNDVVKSAARRMTLVNSATRS